MAKNIKLEDNEAAVIMSDEGKVSIIVRQEEVQTDADKVPAHILLMCAIGTRISKDPDWISDQIEWFINEEMRNSTDDNSNGLQSESGRVGEQAKKPAN